MSRYLKLIATLSLTLSADSLFSAAIIWCVLLAGGTARSLAFFLCIVTLLTFLAKKGSPKIKKYFEVSPQKSFVIIRIIGIVSSTLAIPFSLYFHSLIFLYFSGMIFTVIGFLGLLTSELIIGKAVLENHLTPNKGSRIIQMTQQIAAFFGPIMMGFVLKLGGMTAVFVFMTICYTIGLLVYPIAQRIFYGVIVNNKKKFSGNPNKNTHISLWPIFLGLCFLTTQISAFNFLVPLIAQHEKMWSAVQFGLIDATAGIGAFLCTLISLEKGRKKSLWLISFLIIPLCDFAFHFFDNAYAVALAAPILGFFVNIYWIKAREFMYSSVSCTQDFLDWISRITVMSVFLKAGAPLALTFIVMKPSFLFFLVGIFSGIGMLFCMKQQELL